MIDKMSDELRDLLYRPNKDTIFMTDFNEDEVVHVDLVGKRRVYSEAAYNKLLAERNRLREALRLMVDDYENYPGDISLAIMTRAKAALQEDGDE